MRNNFEEEKFLPRALGQHFRQCQVLNQFESLQQHHSTNYGIVINRWSVPHIHVVCLRLQLGLGQAGKGLMHAAKC